MLIDETLKWFLIVELNFSFVFAPMINVLILFLLVDIKNIFWRRERTMEHFEKILSGLMKTGMNITVRICLLFWIVC